MASEQRSETKWFVYCGAAPYPWHAVVEAATARDAIVRARSEENMIAPIVVFPLEAALIWAPDETDPDGIWPEERRL